MTATSAAVQFGQDGPRVESLLRLTDRTWINCFTYDQPASAPILSIDDAQVRVSMTVPHPDRVTEDDVATARLLAKAVDQYVTELEHLAAASRGGAEGSGDSAGQAA